MATKKNPFMAPDGLEVGGVEGAVLPVGTTAQRGSTPKPGQMRGNSNTNLAEMFINGLWRSMGVQASVVPTPVTSSIVAGSNVVYFLDNTVTAIGISLPAMPAVNDTVTLFDAKDKWGINPGSVLANGKKIERTLDSVALDIAGELVVFTFMSEEFGWKMERSGVSMANDQSPNRVTNAGKDLDTFTSNTKTRVVNATSTSGMPSGIGTINDLYIEVISKDNSTNCYQLLKDPSSGGIWTRVIRTGAPGIWRRLDTSSTVPIAGGGPLSPNTKYLILDDLTYTLPAVTGVHQGDTVEVSKVGMSSPTIIVENPAADRIRFYNAATGGIDSTDTSVLYNIYGNLLFTFYGYWEL